jgi:filamentous hemagglutinin family protein
MKFLNFLRPHRKRCSTAHVVFSAMLGVVVNLTSGPVALAASIPRGNTPVAQSPATSTAGASNPSTTGQTTALSQRSSNVLQRTSQAMQAIKAMQATARNLAVATSAPANLGADPNHPGHQLPNVPNGLVTGGLVPDSGLSTSGIANAVTTWQNAKTPTQSTSNGQTTVNIQQTGQQAILNWTTFNIGKSTTLNFDQSVGGTNVGQWIAFNKILDPSGSPSQILGAMKAQGQVYVINQNGIIFGGASQINLHGLVASSLPINDNLLNRGLLNNPDDQFLFSQLVIPKISQGTMPAFTPPDVPAGLSHDGDVTVQAGAQITSPTTADHVGGHVVLIGPNVTNAGTITTPDGQTILAAGNQVALTAHSSGDPSLRGLDVYIGAVDSASGAATNSGLIEAPRADVTLAGKTVNQLGAIDSTTSVSLNGRIDLLANYNTAAANILGVIQFNRTATGIVTLGQGSLTQILPELSSAETAVGTQLALPSQINIQGLGIHFATDSLLLAPGANATINAGSWASSGGQYSFANTNGQVYLDGGALIDVAGSQDVSASVDENIVSVQLNGAELADSPLQRTGVLRGKTVQVDIRQNGTYNGRAWVGTPLADVSGYVGLIQRSAGELTTSGGSVSIKAGESVILQHGSGIDVSGGWIDYQGATVQTTRVNYNGHAIDLSQAAPDRVYSGISTPYSHYEAGYVQGGNGGAISITAPAVALDGSLFGNTVAGPLQRTPSAQIKSTFAGATILPTMQGILSMPNPGAFALTFQAQSQATNNNPYSPTPPSVIIGSGPAQTAADAFTLGNSGNPLPLSADRKSLVILSPDLVNTDGFGLFTLTNYDGNINVPAGVTLAGAPGGSITLSAANIDIGGNISAPGGSLNLNTYNLSPFLLTDLRATPPSNPARGMFTLESGATLSTAGLVVDERPGSSSGDLPFVTAGGSITINSYSSNLAVGSVADVSGGVIVSAAGKLTYGNGGSIAISAGQDPNLASILGGTLFLGSALEGYSGAKAGSISIQSPLIQIGGDALLNGNSSPSPIIAEGAGVWGNGNTLWVNRTDSNGHLLQPDFFSQGGFGSFTLTGIGASSGVNNYLPSVLIAPGTVIKPAVQSLVAEMTGNNPVSLTTTFYSLPLLRTPANLSFIAKGSKDSFNSQILARGDFVMGAEAVIQTDPQTNSSRGVSISGDTVAVLGSIITPGGAISISGGKDSSALFVDNQTQALATVDLGPDSLLSTAGTTLITPDTSGNGYHTGKVLAGGNITVAGNIVAEAGAVLDVSGATDVLDVQPTYAGVAPGTNVQMVSTRIDSNAGSITLNGGQELFTDATLKGNAGDPSALGGTLTVSSGRIYPINTVASPTDAMLLLTQNGLTIPVPFYSGNETAIGNAVLDTHGDALLGLGYFAADSFNSGGFGSLVLKGVVQFSGNTTLTANRSINAGDGGFLIADPAAANSSLTLNAPYVAVGTAFHAPYSPLAVQNPFSFQGQPYYAAPTYGSGSLKVNASLIDIGNLSLQNIGKADLTATRGDIRGDGTLDIAGDVTLTAGQIYPPTAVRFTIAAYDHGNTRGSVTVAASGSRETPLSAGGNLSIYASTIIQGGVLRAPIGTINLGWNGSGTAPVDLITGNLLPLPTTHQLTLTADSITSVSAIDSATGKGLLIPYGVNSNGNSWIDPAGTDITAGGAPEKSIQISAANVTDLAGAVIDIRGGGDLYAYRFVTGLGGSTDLLASTAGFAVIPGYQADFAPIDPGYGNSTGNGSGIAVGSRVYLGASAGLPAGFYTVLPARYALLPGAFLVIPQSGAPAARTAATPLGSSPVSGYQFNDLNASQNGHSLFSLFIVSPQSVVRAAAEYDDSRADTFLAKSALANSAAVPRLPFDAGHLILQATQSLSLLGSVTATSASGGLGGLVDIGSPNPIDIVGAGQSAPQGSLALNAATLTNFGADSLLIGGIRSDGIGGTQLTVTSNSLTVDNTGTPLAGADLILVSNQTMTLNAGADVESRGVPTHPAETLLLGNASIAGSGDGALLRVSNDSSARIVRTGASSSTTPSLGIGAGALISGASVTLDSTYATALDPGAILSGKSIQIGSGRISLQLANPGALQPAPGLVLSNNELQTLQSAATSLSFLSYTSIDVYGTGQVGAPAFSNLALHAAEIRGFNNSGGTVSFDAKNISLDNSPGNNGPGPVNTANGTLVFNAGTIQLGANQLAIDQFSNVELNATGGILAQNSGGLAAQGALTITTPLITGAMGASHTISAGGTLTIQDSPGNTASVTGGLGASLTLIGNGVAVNSNITLPSGNLTLQATGGDLQIGNLARLDAGGVAQNFFDLVKYTGGGQITLTSNNGDVNVAAGGTINVSAKPGGSDAGVLSVKTTHGAFVLNGSLLGQAGANGNGGAFSLDAGSIPAGSLSGLDSALNGGGFSLARSIRVRTGDVLMDGLASTRTFNLSTDQGSITVAGTIDASGATGGGINLVAAGSVTLLQGSLLTVSGQKFSDAGKGGAVSLEAGSETNGSISSSALLDIQTGSTIDLSVAANTADSAALGDFTGTLHLRAPRTATNNDLQINPVNGTILNASSIVVEGYKLYDLTASGGAISTALKNTVKNDAANFAGSAGTASAGYTSMVNRLFANNTALEPVSNIAAGAELINRTGDLTLASDWDFSTYRFGPNSAPGVLTLRAAGNLVLNATLSDGFTNSTYTAVLLPQNPLLPVNAQSWSYRLAAGVDFSAADFHQVTPLGSLNANSGSLKLGILVTSNNGNVIASGGLNALTSRAVRGRFQVIRTGSGDIDIAAGRDIKLLNQFATIYTAGTQVADATLGGTFQTPPSVQISSQDSLGTVQEFPTYAAQYSLGGGNVTLTAQEDIAHLTQNSSGQLVADSEKQTPDNWLYRRGYVDPATGQFGIGANGDVASTTWWIDFSNFFEGIGALGGGNVSLSAGRNVSNVDAVVPTNARMPGFTDATQTTPAAPNAASLVELGGGDLSVHAGNNIDAGIYYVEKGQGALSAGNSIVTNNTRSASLGTITIPATIDPSPAQWLPTTLFMGKGSYEVSAGGDLLLGPVVNPFLLPGGVSNAFWDKTYFSTYASIDQVIVTSLNGSITLRESSTATGAQTASPILQNWLQSVQLLTSNPLSLSYYQPWIRINESSVEPFATAASLLPSTLLATAFSGDINLVGKLTLSPSPTGTIDLAATGSVNALQINGITTVNLNKVNLWGTSTINLSDANPDSIPGIASPYAYQTVAGTVAGNADSTQNDFLSFIDSLFSETGSTQGTADVLQNKQALHGTSLLHAADPNPVHLYAGNGNISGLTLFSGKAARVVAGQDITDVALYIQNDNASNVSVVSAGRDIIAYDPNSPLRVAAQSSGNAINYGNAAMAGDIQISGPGTLEVLAGRNLDLGIGPNNTDGTGVGITSIGNARNPNLPDSGAGLFVGAGIGISSGLAGSKLGFATFIDQFLNPAGAGTEAARYLPDLGTLLGLSSNTADAQIWTAFNQLSTEEQNSLALDIFYLVLRDTGRDHNNPNSPGYHNYKAGDAAIAALFPGTNWQGDISLTSREIKTKSGGDINIFAPGGQLTVGLPGNNTPAADQGILTEAGGNISIFTRQNVNVGISRIFTLRGGNEIIWSSLGNIAAGASSKTVLSAPPTRVLIDPQSGDVQTDLAGLATGGGIGVLASVSGVAPGDVDLIAPAGTIDAGDAGIRATGNFNAAATQVLNTGNIQAGGASTGTPSVAAPSLAGLTAASNTQGAASSAADQVAKQNRGDSASGNEIPSIITVEVLGYGGGDDDEELNKNRKPTTEGNAGIQFDSTESRPGSGLAMNAAGAVK